MNGFFKFTLLALLIVPLVWITNVIFPTTRESLCGVKWLSGICASANNTPQMPKFRLARTDDKKPVVAHPSTVVKGQEASQQYVNPRTLGKPPLHTAKPTLQLAVDDVLKDGDALFVRFNQPKATPNKGMIEAVWEAPAFDALTLAHRPEMKDVNTITLYHTLTDEKGNVFNFYTYTFDANRLRTLQAGKVTRDTLVTTLIEPTGPRMDKDFSQEGLKAQHEYCTAVNTPAVKASLLCQ